MKNCVSCGQQISKSETICPYCGAAQEERTVLINEMNTQQPVMNQQQMNPQMGYNGQNMQQSYGQPQMNQQMGYDGQNMQQDYGQPQPGYGQQQGYGLPQMNQQMGYNGQNMQQDYGQPQPGYGQQQGYGLPQMNQQMGYNGQNMQQSYGQQKGQPGAKKPVNGKKIGIIAGVAVALVLVIVFVTKFAGPGASSQKAALKSYFKAVVDEDAADYMDACYPKKLQKGIKKVSVHEGDEFMESLEFRLSWNYGYLEDVKKIKITKTIERDKSAIKDFEDNMKDKYNVKLNVSELVWVHYDYEVKKDGKWEEDSDFVLMYKVGGKWFVKGLTF